MSLKSNSGLYISTICEGDICCKVTQDYSNDQLGGLKICEMYLRGCQFAFVRLTKNRYFEIRCQLLILLYETLPLNIPVPDHGLRCNGLC